MKKFYEMYNKFEWIEIIGNKIVDFNCTCEDFQYRKLKKEDNKVKVKGMCKHIKRIIGMYHEGKEIKLK